MTAILVADNEAHWLDEMSWIIRAKGYGVITATNPKEAMAVIGRHQVDIAVLDLRLLDDTQYDISGLNVALDSDRMIPKIIVSEFGNVSDVAHALKIDLNAYPAIVDFLEKGQIQTKLIPAVEHAIRVKDTWFAQAQTKLSEQLNYDYKRAWRDAIIHYWITQVISVSFAAIAFWEAYRLHTEHPTSTYPFLLSVIGILVATVTNYVFGRAQTFLYQRVERYHDELLQTDRFGQLLGMSYSIKDEKAREECKVALFSAAISHWILNSRPPELIRRPKELD